MKIDPKNAQKVTETVASQVPASRGNRPSSAVRAGGLTLPARPAADHLQLSSRAEQYSRLRRELDALPTQSNAHRVSAFGALVARGAYDIDGGAVAGAVLEDEAAVRALGLTPNR